MTKQYKEHAPFSDELAVKICERFAGGETILQICSTPDMPHRSMVYLWLASDDPKYDEFRRLYALATVAHAHALADEVLSIADDDRDDTIMKVAKDGTEYEQPNNEWISRSRLRVETRLKLMEKRAPAIFGQQLQLGGIGGGAIKVENSDRDLGRRMAFLLAAGRDPKLIEG